MSHILSTMAPILGLVGVLVAVVVIRVLMQRRKSKTVYGFGVLQEGIPLALPRNLHINPAERVTR